MRPLSVEAVFASPYKFAPANHPRERNRQCAGLAPGVLWGSIPQRKQDRSRQARAKGPLISGEDLMRALFVLSILLWAGTPAPAQKLTTAMELQVTNLSQVEIEVLVRPLNSKRSYVAVGTVPVATVGKIVTDQGQAAFEIAYRAVGSKRTPVLATRTGVLLPRSLPWKILVSANLGRAGQYPYDPALIVGTWKNVIAGMGTTTWTFTLRPDGRFDATEVGLGNAKGLATYDPVYRRLKLGFVTGAYRGTYDWVLNQDFKTGSGSLMFSSGRTDTFKTNISR